VSPEKQQIAIAEACGWKKEIFLPVSDCSEAELILGYDEITEIWKSPNGQYVRDAFFPDYLNDLNAMHEAEKRLRNQFNTVEEAYWRNLAHVQPHPIYATAAQRAEAFLRTLNLWTDEQ
jgi:hypothetical protein